MASGVRVRGAAKAKPKKKVNIDFGYEHCWWTITKQWELWTGSASSVLKYFADVTTDLRYQTATSKERNGIEFLVFDNIALQIRSYKQIDKSHMGSLTSWPGR